MVYHKRATKMLRKMDRHQAQLLVGWINKNLVGTNDPRQFGKALKGQYQDYWRYRIGNYRIIADILDDQIKINIIDVGHRKEIY
ncbi:type II toxin-antitoxin system RelE family toxin [Aerococcus urinaehominis]|nr:type II toxin-antitoxin system RelE/ParE family toxin [Aerococcus urinaehominis]